MRILPQIVEEGGPDQPDFLGGLSPAAGSSANTLVIPTLGIEEGGLHSAEALLLARYFMYTQLYFHPVRRIYDLRLKTFLKDWLEGDFFSTNLDDHLNLTDNEVMAAIRPGESSSGTIFACSTSAIPTISPSTRMPPGPSWMQHLVDSTEPMCTIIDTGKRTGPSISRS
jgi:HD associated region